MYYVCVYSTGYNTANTRRHRTIFATKRNTFKQKCWVRLGYELFGFFPEILYLFFFVFFFGGGGGGGGVLGP